MTYGRQSGSAAGRSLDRRMGIAFSLLILAITLVMSLAIALLYQKVLQQEEDRLATVISSVIGQAMNRISFSGRYHSQLLIEELRSQQPDITGITVRRNDGSVLVQSGIAPPDHSLRDLDDLIDGRRPVRITDHVVDGKELKEVVLPYRSGYGDAAIGTIHVFISFSALAEKLAWGLTYISALGLVLLAAAMLITIRLSRWLGGAARHMADHLDGILEHAPLLIVIRDHNGTILESSASFRALPPSAAAALLATGSTTITEILGRSPERRDIEIVAEGQSRHFAVTDFAIASDARGNPQRLCTIAADDTVQRTTEVELRERSRELERSNAELEQFAYVASHDLQEPLRMVASYVALIERRYASLLDQNGHDFIAFAKEGAERMQRLILDLLDYSRIGRVGTAKADMDMITAIEAAVTALRPMIEDSGAVVAWPTAPLPVHASANEMIRLWQNLIGNSLKYASPERTARIEITARRDGGGWTFAITDNGIGIEAQYGQRIFMIFQRLHSRDSYPGSGIGLAICQKIVFHHGGRIWLEPQETGARFCFTLPDPAPGA